jgi:hypothetical protein
MKGFYTEDFISEEYVLKIYTILAMGLVLVLEGPSGRDHHLGINTESAWWPATMRLRLTTMQLRSHSHSVEQQDRWNGRTTPWYM